MLLVGRVNKDSEYSKRRCAMSKKCNKEIRKVFFPKGEQKQLREGPCEKSSKIIQALERWRAQSFHSDITVCCVTVY